MRILLIGHGRMGKLVEGLAPLHDAVIAGVVTSGSVPDALAGGDFGLVDVAIDFSTPAAVPLNVPVLAARGMSVVIGTTGWQSHEAALRPLVLDAGIGVLTAANFSLGMLLFRRAVAQMARGIASRPEFGAWIHEAHHAAKLDAPSGTAISIQAAMIAAGYSRAINVSSTRAGVIPGTHTVGFDAATETIELRHTVRDRAVFAHGALAAAAWLQGRRGWFGFEDMIDE